MAEGRKLFSKSLHFGHAGTELFARWQPLEGFIARVGKGSSTGSSTLYINQCQIKQMIVFQPYIDYYIFFRIFSSRPKPSGWVVYIVYVLVDFSPITYSKHPGNCFMASICAALKVGGILHSEIIFPTWNIIWVSRVFWQPHTFVCLDCSQS